MYSGTTFRKTSGGIIGVHQKIDRIARRNLAPLLPAGFPTAKQIIHFEGSNGPDGIKRKSPAVDEPWHYIDPQDMSNTDLLDYVDDHIHNLAGALKADNQERAAFEAAWLAHAIADGLTPAHHYPLSEKIEELWGKPKDERLSIIDKNFIRGNGRRDTISKNWEYWGAKGVFSTHFLFEWGVATTVKPIRFLTVQLSEDEIADVAKRGFRAVYTDAVYYVYNLGMYEEFWKRGWTRKLAGETRTILMPTIIRMVMLAWYTAAHEAEQA